MQKGLMICEDKNTDKSEVISWCEKGIGDWELGIGNW
jgi:hypothetical protein